MDTRNITVTELHCYPIKSCRGISLSTATIGEMGILYDRQWMVVNSNNVFVAQRGDSKLGATGAKSLCLVVPEFTDQHLRLTAPGMQPLLLPLSGSDNGERVVQIWDDSCMGLDQGDEAAAWFTEYLSQEVPDQYRLVKMPDHGNRKTTLGNGSVAFADGYPFSLTSVETLESLNSHLAAAIPMDRFRPSIVIGGGGAFGENTLNPFSINDICFLPVKKDGRCSITTIDQQTALAGREPLATLGTLKENDRYVYRDGNNVYFGMYFVHSGKGTISVGDRLSFAE